MSKEYLLKLEKSVETTDGTITHARVVHGAEGWELWGEVPSGGEIHLDTRYYRESPAIPLEWYKKVATRHLGDDIYTYHRLSDRIYQSKNGAALVWYCDVAVAETMLGDDLDL